MAKKMSRVFFKNGLQKSVILKQSGIQRMSTAAKLVKSETVPSQKAIRIRDAEELDVKPMRDLIKVRLINLKVKNLLFTEISLELTTSTWKSG